MYPYVSAPADRRGARFFPIRKNTPCAVHRGCSLWFGFPLAPRAYRLGYFCANSASSAFQSLACVIFVHVSGEVLFARS